MIALNKKIAEEMSFKQQLKVLSEPGLFLGYLVVKEKNGLLGETNLITFLWEKLKGFLGMPDWSHPRLVELKVMQFLSAGKNEIRTFEEIEQVKFLAWKAGLTHINRHRHSELNALVKEICSSHPSSDNGLIDRFIKHYGGELYPFPSGILKADATFKETILAGVISPAEVAPLVKEEIKEPIETLSGVVEKECLENEQDYFEEERDYLEEDEEYLEENESEEWSAPVKHFPAHSWKATAAKTFFALSSLTLLGLLHAKKLFPATSLRPLSLQELFANPNLQEMCEIPKNIDPQLSVNTPHLSLPVILPSRGNPEDLAALPKGNQTESIT